jgi:HK97 gp10 family phage protein
MSNVVTVNIKGLDELQKKLDELPKSASNKILRTTLMEAGETMREKEVEEAPEHTGFLKEHFDIKVRVKRKDVAATVMVGPSSRVYYPDRGKEMRDEKGRRLVATGKYATAGAQVPVVSVARFAEFGTVHEPGDAFMTRAFESIKDELLANITDGIAKALEEAAKE